MNRLASESSPYLRQHAENPVDWYPWGEEAFAAARARDVPLLLSVGYSTCHWCHVMAHESFENEQIAAFMNAHFVNIKIDREERPDVDGVYMSAVQAMTGSGGWPMTVFALPSGEPFYAGTYFPPTDRQGLPGFARLLSSLASTWQTEREKVLGNAASITAHLRAQTPQEGEPDPLPADFLERSMDNLNRAYDTRFGGFGHAPKFPAPTTLSFLLTQPQGREMALTTLRKMGQGGIYDQLGGGWHRYSVDERWLVPHFEKMLYDNAQLARTLLSAYQASGDTDLLRLARSTLGYLEREMLSPEGGFYSAQDADQDGIEGKFFVWTPQEFEELGEDAGWIQRYFGVTPGGNFLDPHHPEFGRRSVLSVPQPLPELATELGQNEAELCQRLERARGTLFAERQKRTPPGTDDKVLTSWNGLALAAFADAARLTGEARYLDIARRNADFVWANLRDPDGGLLHTFHGGAARVRGLLEDQALYGLGLVALYQAGGDLAHLHWARELWQLCAGQYWDEDAGLFYSTGGPAEALLTRQAQAFDSAVLSDNAAAALLGVWISRYFSQESEGERLARRTVQTFQREMLAAAAGFGGLWQVAAFLQAPHTEIALLGTPQERAPLEAELARHFLPFTALAFSESGGGLELLENRGGAGVAYVCVNRACELPTSKLDVFAGQLERIGGSA
ncbi:thioredoxin domain-containing protein [Deinococcus rubellus]|uniref:Thioredoxin domain-containing protein n=1 Tax=Deinococcus rubellus TaxID=1889240 RepID=A0ABY5YIN8_9DEIO|nr:thioredoxin domain-containing protein [Deinococcus rubellus]UWX64967.1 thioredoxin domain-containing protein [Deinococcus rubellus]